MVCHRVCEGRESGALSDICGGGEGRRMLLGGIVSCGGGGQGICWVYGEGGSGGGVSGLVGGRIYVLIVGGG